MNRAYGSMPFSIFIRQRTEVCCYKTEPRLRLLVFTLSEIKRGIAPQDINSPKYLVGAFWFWKKRNEL